MAKALKWSAEEETLFYSLMHIDASEDEELAIFINSIMIQKEVSECALYWHNGLKHKQIEIPYRDREEVLEAACRYLERRGITKAEHDEGIQQLMAIRQQMDEKLADLEQRRIDLQRKIDRAK